MKISLRATIVLGAWLAAVPALAQTDDPMRDPVLRKVRDAFRIENLALFDIPVPGPVRGAACTPNATTGITACATGTSYETTENGAFSKSFGYHLDSKGRVVHIVSTRNEYPLERGKFDDTLKALGARYGTVPVIITFQGKTTEGDDLTSLIAVWGPIKLVRLSDAELRVVAAGGTVGRAPLIDYRQNVRASAQQRDPVFKLEGQAGFIVQFRSVTDVRTDMIQRVVYPAGFTDHPAGPKEAEPEARALPLDPRLAYHAALARAEEERLAAIEAARRAEEERKAAEARRIAEERARVEAERKAAEERRLAEERAKIEAARKAEEERKAAEERRIAEERARIEAERKAAEERRLAEERAKAEALRKAEEERKAAEERRIALERARVEAERKAAEDRRLAEERARRAEEERKAAEERRIAEERARIEAERKAAEAERKAAEERRIAEERARAEAERKAAEERRAMEERAKRAEAEYKSAVERARKAEAERMAAEERVRQAEADRKTAEDRAKRIEAERKVAEERARREDDERKAIEERRVQAERKAAEERQRRENAERSAAEEKKAEEARRLAAERARLEEEARRVAQDRARREESQRKSAAQAEEERRAAEERSRAAEAERAAAERRRAEAERQADDARRGSDERPAAAERPAAPAAPERPAGPERKVADAPERSKSDASTPAAREAWLRMAMARAKTGTVHWVFNRTRDRISDDLVLQAQAVFTGGDRLAIEIAFECNIDAGKRLKAYVRAFDARTKASLRIPPEDGQASVVRGGVTLDEDAPQTAYLFPERDERQASIVEVPVTSDDIRKNTPRAQVWLRHYQIALKLRLAQGEAVATIYPYDANLRRVLDGCVP